MYGAKINSCSYKSFCSAAHNIPNRDGQQGENKRCPCSCLVRMFRKRGGAFPRPGGHRAAPNNSALTTLFTHAANLIEASSAQQCWRINGAESYPNYCVLNSSETCRKHYWELRKQCKWRRGVQPQAQAMTAKPIHGSWKVMPISESRCPASIQSLLPIAVLCLEAWALPPKGQVTGQGTLHIGLYDMITVPPQFAPHCLLVQ